MLEYDRTHNRIRSPRLIASSYWNNVGKGSRQIRSVTSGERLALRARQTPLPEALRDSDIAAVMALSPWPKVVGSATNGWLRTGTAGGIRLFTRNKAL